MPIRPENRARYPKDWKTVIVPAVRQRSKDRCEFRLDHFNSVYEAKTPKVRTKRCAARNGQPHPITGSKVVLTVAHLDHTPENCDMANLLHGCQRCHNIYDMEHRRQGIKERARAAMKCGELFE